MARAIGVDIGTTSTKAVAFDADGRILAQHAVEYPLLTPVPGAAEQDPDEIVAAVKHALAAVVAQSAAARASAGPVACVSFSAAMHSLIALDESGRPLTRSITWADTRA